MHKIATKVLMRAASLHAATEANTQHVLVWFVEICIPQVNMHCPYSKIRSLELEPGDYIVQVEGYSRYEGKFNLNLLCESACG